MVSSPVSEMAWSVLVRLHLEFLCSVLIPSLQGNIEVLECVKTRAAELVKGLQHRSDEDQLGKLGLFGLEKRSLRGDLITLYNYAKGDRTRERQNLPSSCTKKDLDWILEIISALKEWSGIAQGSCEITSLDVFKRNVDVTLGHMMSW